MYINYEIEFYSFWNCSSGISPLFGDKALAIKDPDGLPYIPGKTLKGIIKETFNNMIIWKYSTDNIQDNVRRNLLKNDFEDLFGKEKGQKGSAHFFDATLSDDEHSYIVATGTQRFLFFERTHQPVSSKKNTYTIEVVVPCKLLGRIYIPSQKDKPDIINLFNDSFGFIKRIGLHHNVGYGRCKMKMTENS